MTKLVKTENNPAFDDQQLPELWSQINYSLFLPGKGN